MKTSNLLAVASLFLITVMPACDHKDHHAIEKPFDIKEHFIAGTSIPTIGAYNRGAFLIRFLEQNKAVIANTRQETTADYTVTKDSIIVSAIGKGDSLVFKFTVDNNHKITSTFYKAYSLESTVTANMYNVSKENLLAGKTFKGEEFMIGNKSFQKDLYYKFSADGKSFGTGLDVAAINDHEFPYTVINGVAFRSKAGAHTHFGFFADSLVASRVLSTNGYSYFGTYGKQ